MTTVGGNSQYDLQLVEATETYLYIPNGPITSSPGGTAIGTTVNSDGQQDVDGGTAISTTVNGGYQELDFGGTAISTTVNGGGIQFIRDGTASDTTINSGCYQDVGSAFPTVSFGGIAISTTVNGGGTETVFSGGTAISTTISSGGAEIVYSGGTAVGTTVNSGGYEFVNSGGIDGGTIISGGTLELTDAISLNSGIILFSGLSGFLDLDGSTISADSISNGVISGLTAGDIIDLTGVSFSNGGACYLSAGNVLTIVENGGSATLQLDASQTSGGLSFKLSSDGNSGTDINVRSGLSMNVTFDPNVSGAPSGFKEAINSAASYFENTFTNAATLNLDVGWGAVSSGSIGSGAAATSLPVAAPTLYTFNQISGGDSYLSGRSDVTSGGTFWVGEAEAKALGLVSGNSENGNTFDGYLGFNTTLPWSYSNTVGPGQIYLVGTAEHEISEVMGRVDYLSATFNGTVFPYYSVLDLFRYSALNVPDITRVPPGSHTSAYFSINNGQTNLGTFNTQASGR
jgi:autotransporter passenger strand-loop-strand repeat protein